MLAITVRLRFGVYDAAEARDPKLAEWPPHPARLFDALAAGGPSPEEETTLRWLEQQEAPEIWCPEKLADISHVQFMVTNQVKEGSPLRPGRTARERRKASLSPARPVFSFIWPEADPAPDTVSALRTLARKVAYLGRSTSQADIDVHSAPPTLNDVQIWRQTTLDADGPRVGIPYPGYFDAIEEAFQSGTSSWHYRRTRPYTVFANRPPQDDAVGAEPPLFRLLVLTADVRRFDVQHTARLTGLLRSAVLSLVPDPMPTALHAHAGQERHVAFLALPHVGTPRALPGRSGRLRVGAGAPYADGTLMGLGLAVPVDMPEEDIRRLVRAMDQPWDLWVPAGPNSAARPVAVTRQRGRPETWSTDPWRWVAPSAVWVTATPIVHDQYPHGRSEDDMVAQALVHAGYPEPVEVYTQRSPLVPGAANHRPSSVLRRSGAKTKPYTHAWVEFDRPVTGPVIAGSMRYRGLGLFVPVTEVEKTTEPGVQREQRASDQSASVAERRSR